jgi:uncharacterized protein (TIGR03435 family)
MTQQDRHTMASKTNRAMHVILLAALSLLLTNCFHAQSPTPAEPARQFDVVTIKPTDPNADPHSNGGMGFDRDKFTTNGQTVKSLIKFAYGLNFGSDDQIAGGPAWIGTSMFNITAKEDAETVAAMQALKPGQQMTIIKPMVQQVLADRFQLKMHHETRTLAVYALVVAKNGPKLTPFVEMSGAPQKGWQGLQMQGRGMMEGRAAQLDMFTGVLSMQHEINGRTVVNHTGLNGKYNFMLKWTPEQNSAADAATSTDAAGPSLFTALQEQMGLRLESTKAPVDVIVIDSVALPTEN